MALLSLVKFPSTLFKAKRALENGRRFGDADPFDFVWETRVDQYAQNKAMLENSIYDIQQDGGFREVILEELFGITGTDSEDVKLRGHYNPARNVVEAYQNCFRGKWGQEIKVADTVDDKPVNPALIEPLRRIWKWSNLDTQKQVFQEWAANLGTVGFRIVAKADPDPFKRRVAVQLDNPGTIVDFNEDDRGNVTDVLLKYNALSGPLGDKRFDVEVEELFTKAAFKQVANGKTTVNAENPLGVCPYVILRHDDDGHEFGRWAYKGSESIIHGINWLISNQGESIVEHVWPTWFGTGGGPSPDQFEFNRKRLLYVRTDANTPNPLLEPLVAPLNQADAREYWKLLIATLVDRQPELVISNIEALSGQSGETIAKLLIPAEAAIEKAKANYEHALKRALQIGLSEGVRIGLWNLGTGMGTPEAANRAYDEGLEEFEFAPRRALPETVFDKINQAKADDAAQASKLDLMGKASNVTAMSSKQVLRIGGNSEADVAKISRERQAEDEAVAALDGTDGGNAQNP